MKYDVQFSKAKQAIWDEYLTEKETEISISN
jgi:hypothetical protein